MSKFTDAKGREWEVRLTVGLLGDVRRQTGRDLGAALKTADGLHDLLFGDPAALAETLWVICQRQAAGMKDAEGNNGVTPEEFGYGFDGPTVEAAAEAVLSAVSDFFPRSKIGAVIKAGLRKTLDRMDQEIVDQISKSLDGGLLASPALTPDPDPSANSSGLQKVGKSASGTAPQPS